MKGPRASAIDDKATLKDLRLAMEALQQAEDNLTRAMVGQGRSKREAFIFYTGMAKGRLSRVTSRIYGERVPDIPDGVITVDNEESDP
jgi:hypothetical protein